MPVIEVRGLTKRFGRFTAVDGLSFTVEAGEIVGFLGPNGAGKTTTLRMLLGLVSPSAGTATINGVRYQDLPAPLRTVGAALESSAAYPGRTARRHLQVAALLAGTSGRRIEEVLDLVDLTDAADLRVGRFSLGMRQRLALATALIGDPDVLILDEPANGLDPEGAHWLRQTLRDLANDGCTVLVSSHVLTEVAQTVDSVIIVEHGRLAARSTLCELTSGAEVTVHVTSPQAPRLAALLIDAGAQAKQLTADKLEVTGASGEQIGTLAATHSIAIYEATTNGADLEGIFLRLTRTLETPEAIR